MKKKDIKEFRQIIQFNNIKKKLQKTLINVQKGTGLKIAIDWVTVKHNPQEFTFFMVRSSLQVTELSRKDIS